MTASISSKAQNNHGATVKIKNRFIGEKNPKPFFFFTGFFMEFFTMYSVHFRFFGRKIRMIKFNCPSCLCVSLKDLANSWTGLVLSYTKITGSKM